jgi:hypothetical protein
MATTETCKHCGRAIAEVRHTCTACKGGAICVACWREDQELRHRPLDTSDRERFERLQSRGGRRR